MDQDSAINTLHLITHLILKKVLSYIFIHFASKDTEYSDIYKLTFQKIEIKSIQSISWKKKKKSSYTP